MLSPVAEATLEIFKLSDDINLIMQKLNNKSYVARELGIDRSTVYRYANGCTLPNDAIVLRAIQIWADRIRNEN